MNLTTNGSTVKMRKDKGFTLLEVIIVMALLGLIMATIRYTVFAEDITNKIGKEVQRLQVVFDLASDYSVINQSELGLRIDDDKKYYEFVRLDDNNEWTEISEPKQFAKRELPPGVTLELLLDGLPWQDEDSLFDNRIFDEELSVSDESVEIGDDEDEPPPPPQIFILSSGEITPFELRVEYQPQEIDETPFYFVLQGIDTVPLIRQGPL